MVKSSFKWLDHPRLTQVAIVALLLVMAVLTPRHMPGWIDEFWNINYGQNVFGHTEIAPQNNVFWGGVWLSALFHEWLPGMFGQRWLSWLSTVGMALAALRLGRLTNVNRTTAAWIVVLLLLAPEVRFEGQNGRVDNLAMMWVFLALGQNGRRYLRHIQQFTALAARVYHKWFAGNAYWCCKNAWPRSPLPRIIWLPYENSSLKVWCAAHLPSECNLSLHADVRMPQ